MNGDNINIIIGGQVIGTAKSGMLTYLDTEDKPEDKCLYSNKGLNKSWDISCNALVHEDDVPDPLKEMMQGPQLVNVQITRPVGKMPRKIKKADKRDPYGKTKWGRKAINYRRTHNIIINDAEIVVTKEDQETLTATLTKTVEERKRLTAFGWTLTGHDELEPNAPSNAARLRDMEIVEKLD